MPVAESRLEILQICKLLQSVREKDKIQIEKLVLNGIPHLINYNEPTDGDTPLNVAASANDGELIEFLLDLGAHPDVMDFKGRSSVMRAADYGHVEALEKLCKSGADLKLRDIDGQGIIFYCLKTSSQRHKMCLKMALEHGADVNNKTVTDKPVFVSACEIADDHEQECLKLLECGADPNAVDPTNGRTALISAAGAGNANVVRAILAKGGDVDAVTKTGKRAAHEAAKGGHLEVLQVLAAYGADFDRADNLGNTPIHYAALGHPLCVRFLFQRGCNPKPKNNDGFVARAVAKDNGFKDCLKEVKRAEKGFGKIGKANDPWAVQLYDFCAERQEKLLALFQKLDQDNIGQVSREDFVDALVNSDAPLTEEAVKRLVIVYDINREGLIDYGDFLNGKKYLNKNYLHTAFVLKKKKKKGGKKKGKAGKFKLPVPICVQNEGPRTEGGGPPEVFIPKHQHFTDRDRFDNDNPPAHCLQDDSRWYLDSPPQSYININDAAKTGDIDSLKDALKRGYDLDIRDKFYKTPLMIAAGHANIDVVKFLVENGADINAADNFSWTPLHHACHAGILDTVAYLIENGANLNALSINRTTPLMRAIENSRYDVVKLLIDSGAKLQTENRKGWNPVDLSVIWADPRVYECVKTKWDSLPPPPDKKKMARRKPKPTRPKTAPVQEQSQAQQDNKAEEHIVIGVSEGQTETIKPVIPTPQLETQERRGSILRAASALASGLDEKEDITIHSLNIWTQQPTTQERIQSKHVKSDRFGWEVDFPEFQMPFNKHIDKRVQLLGGVDD